jgi:hypothetical protein
MNTHKEQRMTEQLIIHNEGPEITGTNFWMTANARAGKFYLTSNAGAFRLLVPTMQTGNLRDMRAATVCVVTRGPYPGLRLPDALELLFDDGSPSPFALYLSPGALDRMPLDTDRECEWVLSVWTHVVQERCKKELERPCHYRHVRSLPDLRPWRD